jgi:hypothetical protein
MRKMILLIIVFLLAACSPSEAAVQTAVEETRAAQPTNTYTSEPPTPTITLTPAPTDTPRPTKTNTPEPTHTPRPTNTRKPTATSTPEPLLLNGTGDSIVDVSWDGPGLLHVTYAGGGNFAVWNYASNGDRIDLLVNTIGSYEGTLPLDFMDYEDTARFQIKSSGTWEIQILPLGTIRRIDIPGTFTGTGDVVVFLQGGDPDILVVDASAAKGNFVIWTYGQSRDLVVNEIAPYTGMVMVSKDDTILVIKAEGDWSIEVKTR